MKIRYINNGDIVAETFLLYFAISSVYTYRNWGGDRLKIKISALIYKYRKCYPRCFFFTFFFLQKFHSTFR